MAVSNKISVEDLWKKYKDDNVLMGDVMAERYCFYFEKAIDVKKIHYFSLLTPKCCFCKKCNARQYPCQQSINELEAMIKKCYEKSKMDPTVFENKIRKNFALIICKKNRGREQISFDNKSKTDKEYLYKYKLRSKEKKEYASGKIYFAISKPLYQHNYYINTNKGKVAIFNNYKDRISTKPQKEFFAVVDMLFGSQMETIFDKKQDPDVTDYLNDKVLQKCIYNKQIYIPQSLDLFTSLNTYLNMVYKYKEGTVRRNFKKINPSKPASYSFIRDNKDNAQRLLKVFISSVCFFIMILEDSEFAEYFGGDNFSEVITLYFPKCRFL